MSITAVQNNTKPDQANNTQTNFDDACNQVSDCTPEQEAEARGQLPYSWDAGPSSQVNTPEQAYVPTVINNEINYAPTVVDNMRLASGDYGVTVHNNNNTQLALASDDFHITPVNN